MRDAPKLSLEKPDLLRLHDAAYDYFHQPSNSTETVEEVARMFNVDAYELQTLVHIINRDYMTALRREMGA